MSTRILVVDDAEQVRIYCARVLRRAGYQVRTASLAQDALDLMEDEPADLLVTDIMMPEMDGMELTHIVTQRYPDMGVVIMTAYSTLDRAIEAVRASAHGFLPKPFTSGELLEAVEHALRQMEQARQRARIDAMLPLLELSRRSLDEMDLDGLAETILDTVISQTAAEAAMLLMADDETASLTLAAVRGMSLAGDVQLEALRELPRDAEGSFLVGDETCDSPEVRDWLVEHEIDTAISIPLRTARRLVGFLLLVTRKGSQRSLAEGDRQLASVVAGQAAAMLDNLRLVQELGAWNRELEQRVEERTKELREAQERLLRSERLATVGKLGSGVAHELRNPLGVIKNSIYYLRFMLGDEDVRITKHLDIVDREVTAANEIITGLMSFVRVGDVEVMPTNPNELLQKTLERARLPGSIALHLDLAPGLPVVSVDGGKMQQVFLNLINNAVQAMPDGGELTLRTVQEGDELRFIFRDTGNGVPPENREQIFEPLFTTKAKGIGLGLAIVKMLVEAHDGHVTIESLVDQGSIFTVHLPVAER